MGAGSPGTFHGMFAFQPTSSSSEGVSRVRRLLRDNGDDRARERDHEDCADTPSSCWKNGENTKTLFDLTAPSLGEVLEDGAGLVCLDLKRRTRVSIRVVVLAL